MEKYQTHWNASAAEIAERMLHASDTTYIGHWKEFVNGEEKTHVVLYSSKKLEGVSGFLQRCCLAARRFFAEVRYANSIAVLPGNFRDTGGGSVLEPAKLKVIGEIFEKALSLESTLSQKDRTMILGAMAKMAAKHVAPSLFDYLITLPKDAIGTQDVFRDMPHTTVEVRAESEAPRSLWDSEWASLDLPKKKQRVFQFLNSFVGEGHAVLSPEQVRDLNNDVEEDVFSHNLTIILEDKLSTLPHVFKLHLVCGSQSGEGCIAKELSNVESALRNQNINLFVGPQNFDRKPQLHVLLSKRGGKVSEMEVCRQTKYVLTDASNPNIIFATLPIALITTFTATQDEKTKVRVQAQFQNTTFQDRQYADIVSALQENFKVDQEYVIDQPLDPELLSVEASASPQAPSPALTPDLTPPYLTPDPTPPQ